MCCSTHTDHRMHTLTHPVRMVSIAPRVNDDLSTRKNCSAPDRFGLNDKKPRCLAMVRVEHEDDRP